MKHGRIPDWSLAAVAILAGIGIAYCAQDAGRDECRRLLSRARTASDTLVVYTAKPGQQYSTCGQLLR